MENKNDDVLTEPNQILSLSTLGVNQDEQETNGRVNEKDHQKLKLHHTNQGIGIISWKIELLLTGNVKKVPHRAGKTADTKRHRQ